jgi:hypothetical protein
VNHGEKKGKRVRGDQGSRSQVRGVRQGIRRRVLCFFFSAGERQPVYILLYAFLRFGGRENMIHKKR